jgi:hypothetical protein
LAKLIYAIGTRSKFDYGTYIFDETVMHGKSHAVKMPIAFPTLICDIILNQHPGICTEADVPKRMESYLSLDYRLFEGTHAADIVAPVAAHNARQPTNILTRDQIIVDLKEVSRILGKKKGMVDLVVHTLEFEKTAAACAGIEGTSSVIPHVTEDDADDVGGDTEVEEEHSDASPLVCSA